jgi:hypothetical protein
VAPEADVLLLQNDESVPADATAFDLPGAQWSRQARYSTYETILRTEGITDSTLLKIGGLIHASEFSSWILSFDSDEGRFDRLMKELSLAGDIESAHAFLDSLYARDGALDEELYRRFQPGE